MKNRKGFTLIELLVVIALIGLLIAIAVPSGLKASKKIKEKMLDSKIKLIESGAIVWGQNNKTRILSLSESNCSEERKNEENITNCISVSISELLNNHVLEEDDIKDINGDGTEEKILINPVTNKPLNNCNVEIYIKNKRVYAKYDVSDTNCDKKEETKAFLLGRDTFNSSDKTNYTDFIYKIEFVKHINHGAETIDCDDDADGKWCVADTSNGTKEDAIIAWIEKLGAVEWILYIGSNQEIYAPIDSRWLFAGFTRLIEVNFYNFNTSQVTSMEGMFDTCHNLTTLNLSNFDTSQVTSMEDMFRGCSSLTTLDLSYFNISKVTNMEKIFADCISLTTIYLNNYDSQNKLSSYKPKGAKFYPEYKVE